MTLPPDFRRIMAEGLGPDEFTLLAEALAESAPTSVRLNTGKAHAGELTFLEGAEGVPWCETGFYLPERPAFTFDPLFHAGCYYVQEASSMFLSHVLKQHVGGPVVALDLCAAPGGKATLALSGLPEGSLLVANEVVRQRANILAENIIKWGNPSCIVTNNHAADFQAFSGVFDLIVCDAPCSGEGMFRKDPESIGEWSPDNVEMCRRRQRDIVRDIWPTLKEGGLFIYSTCTYNPMENEENVEWAAKTLGAEVLSCHPRPEWGLTETHTHFFPHRVKGEGFFICVMRKTADDGLRTTSRNKKKGKNGKAAKMPAELQEWLKHPADFCIMEEEGAYLAVPMTLLDLYRQARRNLNVIHAGIELATQRGKNLPPCHSLAMSQHLNPEAFPTVEVEEQQAIAYLRSEAMPLPADTPRGHVLVAYRNHPLGFMKNIGSRANNLYPAEWRIRSGHVK